jgi:hypothetical protein
MNGDRLARLTAINGRDKAVKDPGHPVAVSTREQPEPERRGNEPAGSEDPFPFAAQAGNGEPEGGAPPAPELELLRAENADLRRTADELRQILEEGKKLEESWAQREKEYESLLEEKFEVIRELHLRL